MRRHPCPMDTFLVVHCLRNLVKNILNKSNLKIKNTYIRLMDTVRDNFYLFWCCVWQIFAAFSILTKGVLSQMPNPLQRPKWHISPMFYFATYTPSNPVVNLSACCSYFIPSFHLVVFVLTRARRQQCRSAFLCPIAASLKVTGIFLIYFH